MAISRVQLASILIFLAIVNLVESNTIVNVTRTVVKETDSDYFPLYIDCPSECNRRCRLSSRPNLCNRACGTCCQRCHCVPSGTYGHYEECPCYANMTTHGGRHKCP
ncbi:gibberellin-regulated protein 1 [Cajanus cajan]|nr:gibberellin-regulated protein 1 [Cajanus cajan]